MREFGINPEKGDPNIPELRKQKSAYYQEIEQELGVDIFSIPINSAADRLWVEKRNTNSSIAMWRLGLLIEKMILLLESKHDSESVNYIDALEKEHAAVTHFTALE